MSDDIQIRRRKLADYIHDSKNANKGNERGKQVLTDSFVELGAGRSLLAGEDDVLIAGNHAADAALAAGIEDAIEIEVPADALVVVKRRDMSLSNAEDLRARRMANADNLAHRANFAFDIENLLADGMDAIEGFLRDDEIEDLLNEQSIAAMVNDKLDSSSGNDRQLGDKKKQIKPVLYADEVALFEEALLKTGLRNRGQALLAVCRYYLETVRDADAKDGGIYPH